MVKKNLSALLRQSPLGQRLDLASLALISERAEACPLQDPFRIRARFIGWKAASILLDEKGELRRDVLEALRGELARTPYPVGFDQESDAWLYKHLLLALNQLAENESLWKALKKCSLPLSGKVAEEVVRATLWPDEVERIQTPHVRRAALTAWLTWLRQGTGSCFATAPGIWVQEKEPLRMIQDLEAILSAGQLRRGLHTVPMNLGGGIGDLKKPLGDLPILFSPGIRAGFHAAGFAPVEAARPLETAESIFASALLAHFGLTQDDVEADKASLTPHFNILWERGGGHLEAPSPKTKQIREWEKAKERAERAFLAIADCALLRCWEYTIASLSDVKMEFARWNLYVSLGLHPDQRPNGIGAFLQGEIQRRIDAAQRQIVELQREYQDKLGRARTAENLLRRGQDMESHRLQAELTEAIHAIDVLEGLIRKAAGDAQWLANLFPLFLNEAIERLQGAFQEVFDPAIAKPGEGQFEDRPAGFRLLYKHGRSAAAAWERIDGERAFVDAVYRFFESLEREFVVERERREEFTALMTALIQYIRSDEFLRGAQLRAKENKITKKGTPWAYESGGTMQNLVQSYFEWPKAPAEFSRKIHSPRELMAFVKEAAEKLSGNGPYLMMSPTHAFLFQPRWIREAGRGTHFLKNLAIDADQADFLAERLGHRLPERLRPLFFYGIRQSGASDVRKRLIEGIQATKEAADDLVDGFLYESLPLLRPEAAEKTIGRLLQALGVKQTQRVELPFVAYLTAREVLAALKSALAREGIGPFSSIDWDEKIADEARREGLIYPQPVVFADTNWSEWSFGFVQNFSTAEWELWRLNRTAVRGFPMGEWREIFREGGTWSILL